VRFFKQKDSNTCGPIALLNVRLWSGQKVSFKKNFQECVKACKCDNGTQRSNFTKALNQFKNDRYEIDTHNYINLNDLRSHVVNGGIAVLLYYPKKEWYSHYCLVVDKIGSEWIIINDGCKSVKCNVLHNKMKEYMKREFIDGVWFPKLWLISKTEE